MIQEEDVRLADPEKNEKKGARRRAEEGTHLFGKKKGYREKVGYLAQEGGGRNMTC